MDLDPFTYLRDDLNRRFDAISLTLRRIEERQEQHYDELRDMSERVGRYEERVDSLKDHTGRWLAAGSSVLVALFSWLLHAHGK